MSFAIRVREEARTPILFEKSLTTAEEMRQVDALCIDREPIDSKAQVFVVRTDTRENFYKDFFFPGLIGALKAQELVERIFMSFICFVVDLLTFPLRCITLIPRYFQNQAQSKETHPLYQYLLQQGADPRILSRNEISLEKREIRTQPDGNFEVFHQRKCLRFIEIPKHESDLSYDSGHVTGVSLNELRLV